MRHWIGLDGLAVMPSTVFTALVIVLYIAVFLFGVQCVFGA